MFVCVAVYVVNKSKDLQKLYDLILLSDFKCLCMFKFSGMLKSRKYSARTIKIEWMWL